MADIGTLTINIDANEIAKAFEKFSAEAAKAALAAEALATGYSILGSTLVYDPTPKPAPRRRALALNGVIR
jgi:hypothetical protein